MEQTNAKSNKSGAILGILLLLALLLGGYFWNQNKSLSATNQELNTEITTLRDLRDDLISDIDLLKEDYTAMINDNEMLEASFEKTTQEIKAKEATIKKIKADFAKNAVGMKAEIEQLRNIKKELTTYVNQLKAENASLKASNSDLATQVANVEAENRALAFEISQMRQMNGMLEKDKKALMATATRATDLRVDISKKGNKPTGSYRRAKEIAVSFAISNLPENKKGDHNIYVVIKDAKGIPVKVANPIKANITSETSGQSEEIIAQQKQIRNLFEKVRLQLLVNPIEGSLRKGYYRVSVYADWGLLGGAEFQLR